MNIIILDLKPLYVALSQHRAEHKSHHNAKQYHKNKKLNNFLIGLLVVKKLGVLGH